MSLMTEWKQGHEMSPSLILPQKMLCASFATKKDTTHLNAPKNPSSSNISTQNGQEQGNPSWIPDLGSEVATGRGIDPQTEEGAESVHKQNQRARGTKKTPKTAPTTEVGQKTAGETTAGAEPHDDQTRTDQRG